MARGGIRPPLGAAETPPYGQRPPICAVWLWRSWGSVHAPNPKARACAAFPGGACPSGHPGYHGGHPILRTPMGDGPQQLDGAAEGRTERAWPLLAHATTDPNGFLPKPAAAKRHGSRRHRTPAGALPLTIANHAGWAIRVPVGVRARWNGEDAVRKVEVEVLDPTHPARSWVADHYERQDGDVQHPLRLPHAARGALLVRGAPNLWSRARRPWRTWSRPIGPRRASR